MRHVPQALAATARVDATPTMFFLVAATSLVALAACSAKQPSPADLEASEIAYLSEMIEGHQRIQDTMLARLELEYQRAMAGGTPDDRTFDVLILSGGGSKGAFGAGFLRGWGEVTDPNLARPAFDLVTGVSTGSLIAPYALLGDASAYATADEIYRNPSAEWARRRSLLDVFFKQESLFDDAGLLREVERLLAPQIDEIAAEADEHRLLLVGAANLNQGLTRTWNLTELAEQVRGGTLSAEEFARRNISSASIPFAFPPQVIDGNVYVDGGTTGDILFLDAFDQDSSAMQRWAQLHPGVPLARVRLWVIANTSLVAPPVAPDTRDVAVAKRALQMSVLSGLNGQLARLDLIARWLRDARGIDVEFRFVALPDGYVPKGPGLFSKADMDYMSDLGARMGRDPSSWRTQVSDPESPEVLRQGLQRRLETGAAKPGPGVS
jgi:hypothetical protein